MGGDITNQIYPLTHEERIVTKEMLKEYYEKTFLDIISNLNGRKLHPLFGIETEYHGVDSAFNPVPNAGKTVREAYSEVHEDCGTQMLELNSSPLCANSQGAVLCLDELLQKEDIMRAIFADKFDSQPLPIGILPTFSTDEDYGRFVPERRRAQLINPYILEFMKPDDLVFFEEGTGKRINYGKVAGGLFMNSLHISASGTDDRHSVLLYNIANALSGPMIALAANSSVVDRKPITFEDGHLFVYEQNKEIVNGVPRVGNFPEYLDSLNDYFRAMLEFNPIFKFDEEKPVESLHNHFSGTWPWVRAQVNDFYRVEFRSVPKQPTLIEDMAVSSMYLYSLLALEEEMKGIRSTKDSVGKYCNKVLFPCEYLISNSHAAARDGFDSKLAWGNGFAPAQQILQELYGKAMDYMKRHDVGEDNISILKAIKPRIDRCMNPSRKFRSSVKERGFEGAMEEYFDHTINRRDTPYVN